MKQIEKLNEAVYYLENTPESIDYAVSLIKDFIRANEVVTVGKIDPFAFCDNGKNGRLQLKGVYYNAEMKHVCASDGQVLFTCKSLYKENFANKIISKTGEEIDVSFPKYGQILHDAFANEKEDFPFTKEEILAKIKEYQVLKKLRAKEMNPRNTFIKLAGSFGISIRLAKLLVKFDFENLNLRYYEKRDWDKRYSGITYQDEDMEVYFLCQFLNPEWGDAHVLKDGLIFIPELCAA